MDDEGLRREEVNRGQQAKRVIDDPLWAESWEYLESRLMTEWRVSKPDQQAKREHIYLVLEAGRGARKYIEQVLKTGELAERQLKEMSK